MQHGKNIVSILSIFFAIIYFSCNGGSKDVTHPGGGNNGGGNDTQHVNAGVPRVALDSFHAKDFSVNQGDSIAVLYFTFTTDTILTLDRITIAFIGTVELTDVSIHIGAWQTPLSSQMNKATLNLVSQKFEKGTYTGIVYANIATTGTVECNISLDVTQGLKKYSIGPPDGPIVTVN